ncbi:GNAT family N-acetyltransferase [Nocardiopsis sp. LOL_012]|uniref:GNAT family N-acetyltransferase n=1 Tax=Nocardiopsis sp. LOL_012 TaxID=3345409 RepID=UPI003A8818D2
MTYAPNRAGAAAVGEVALLRVGHDDPRASGLLAGLKREYTERYGAAGAARELALYPLSEFAAPHGCLVLAELGGEVVAGGAVRPYVAERAAEAGTAEIKRVWTSPRHRRRGLARTVMAELEGAARDLGYTRVLLYTGPAQPEALALYGRIGYRRLGPGETGALPHPTAIPFGRDLAP